MMKLSTPRSVRTSFRGHVLVTTLAVVMAAGVLTMAVLGASVSSAQLSHHRSTRDRAFALAEAGLSHAVRSLIEDPDYAGQPLTAFGEGEFQVEVQPDPEVPNRREVTSTGQVAGPYGKPITRRVRASVDLASRVWDYALLSERDLTLAAQFRTQSLPEPNRASVHSNRDLVMTDGALVDGRASAVGATTVGATAVVTDGIYPASPAVALPSLDVDAVRQEAATLGVTSGDVSVTSGTRTLRGRIEGNLNVSSTGVLKIDGLLWVTGTATLSGRSYGGDGLLVVEGTTQLAGGIDFTGLETNSLALVVLATDRQGTPAVSIAGQARVRGGLLVPNGTIFFGGQAIVYGTVASSVVSGDGQAQIIRDTSFRPPSQLADPQVRFWQEL